MISSELPEILGISDRILVMREGRIAGELARRGDAGSDHELATGLEHSGRGHRSDRHCGRFPPNRRVLGTTRAC